jgi:cellulose synthase/poly-beta-1,6-N-acetylglucosamine synthase-like glycosyltransferase
MRECSIVVRTYGEELVPQIAHGLNLQNKDRVRIREIVFVDGSELSDTWLGKFSSTIDDAKVSHLRYTEQPFSYGRALNMGIAACSTDIVISLSGHSIPHDNNWLEELTSPFHETGNIVGVCGGQRSRPGANFIERAYRYLYYQNPTTVRVFNSFNMTNAAILRSAWAQLPFDENVPCCEDKLWALKQSACGRSIMSKPSAWVYHSHDEGVLDTVRALVKVSIGRLNVHQRAWSEKKDDCSK